MKFWKKFKPSRVVRKSGEPGSFTHAIEGALLKVEPRETKQHGAGGKKVTEDHLILYATNAQVFVRIDLGAGDRGDLPGPIPLPALRHMENGVLAELGEKEIRVGITHYDRVFTDGLLVDPPAMESFPEWDEILKKEGIRSDPNGRDHLTVDLDPKLLLAAAEAMGETKRVKLTFDLRKTYQYPRQKRRWYRGPVRVKPSDDFYRTPHSEALLMPIVPFGVERDPKEQ